MTSPIVVLYFREEGGGKVFVAADEDGRAETDLAGNIPLPLRDQEVWVKTDGPVDKVAIYVCDPRVW